MSLSKVSGLACLALALGGCTDQQDELRSWMDQQRAAAPLIKDSIAPPRKFEPFRYDGAELSDPFSQSKLVLAIPQSVQKSSGLRPDTSRKREVLESFQLDTIRMVGHMGSGKDNFALLQVGSMVYQARIGNHVGPNFGRITRGTEEEVTLRELVQDATGDWVERDTSLRLQEGRK
jgi:type IV pilus assembly protein PilP